MAAVLCCFAWGPGSMLDRANPPRGDGLCREDGFSLQRRLSGRQFPKPRRQHNLDGMWAAKARAYDNSIPIRPVRAHSAVPRPVIIHRAKPPEPARAEPRRDGKIQF